MATAEETGPETQLKDTTQEAKRRSAKLGTYVVSAALLVIFIVVIGFGFISRRKAEADLKQSTAAAAIPTVNVVYPKAGAPNNEIVLPGNTQAFTDAPIFARTNGYVKSWHVDIGTRVKKGQLLAEIETPEVDQQLQQARADLQTAQANLRQAQITADRWEVDSNTSNVRRLEELQGFQKIYAPFDGVITARNTDIGALINSGASTPTQELFHLAAINILRVFVAVPQLYSPAVRPGATATLTLDEFPGKVFNGTIARNSNSIDPASRTLLVEVDADNRAGQLLPGAYVLVHLKLPESISSVTVPANTLLFRSEGLRVGVVRNGRAALVPVTIGRDYGNSVEIVSGLQPTDSVIINPSDSLIDGTAVRVNPSPAQATAK